MKQQVLSISQMNHLQELGFGDDKSKFPLTLQDIIDLLPKAITYNGLIYEFKIQYSNLKKLWQTCYWNYGTFADGFCESESLLDAAYELLC